MNNKAADTTSDRERELTPLANSFQFDAHLEDQLAAVMRRGATGWLEMKPLQRLALGHYQAYRTAHRDLSELRQSKQNGKNEKALEA